MSAEPDFDEGMLAPHPRRKNEGDSLCTLESFTQRANDRSIEAASSSTQSAFSASPERFALYGGATYLLNLRNSNGVR